MKKLLFLLLLVSGVASAQYAPTSSKTRFVNGIGLGTKSDAAFGTVDSLVLYASADSTLKFKFKGTARALMYAANVGAQIHDSLYAVYQLKAGTSAGVRLVSNSGTVVSEWGLGGSANMDFHGFAGYDANRSASYTARSFTDKGYVDSLSALKLKISDTATMLSPYQRSYNAVTLTGTQTITGAKTFNAILNTGSRLNVNGAADNSSYALNVTGNGLMDALFVNGAVGIAPTVIINRSNNAYDPPLLSFRNLGSEFAFIECNSTTGMAKYSVGPAPAWGGYHAFFVDASERARIANDGALLLNTTTSDGVSKLRVNGIAKIESRLNVNGATDNSSYQLNVTGNINASGNLTAANISSGTYSPTISGTSNVTSVSASTAQYMRVGNTVTVSGMITATPSSTSASFLFYMTVPVASSFASETQAAGVASKGNNKTPATACVGAISAEGGGSRVLMTFSHSPTTTSGIFFYSFTYQII